MIHAHQVVAEGFALDRLSFAHRVLRPRRDVYLPLTSNLLANTLRFSVDEMHQVGPQLFGVDLKKIEDLAHRAFSAVRHREKDVLNV